MTLKQIIDEAFAASCRCGHYRTDTTGYCRCVRSDGVARSACEAAIKQALLFAAQHCSRLANGHGSGVCSGEIRALAARLGGEEGR